SLGDETSGADLGCDDPHQDRPRRLGPAAHAGALRHMNRPSPGAIGLVNHTASLSRPHFATGQASVSWAAGSGSWTVSGRMSIRQPVSLAASRAFWPSLPMARDSW